MLRLDLLRRRLPLIRLIALLGSVLLMPVASPVAAEEVVWIASGPKGGTYRSIYATNLGGLLRDQSVYYRDSAGSAENVELLLTGKADIGFVQADVYALAYALDRSVGEGLQVMGQLASECLYLAYRKEGRATSFESLATLPLDKPARIALGPAAGGPAGSWAWLTTLDPRLEAAAVDSQGGTLALNQLALGRFDAVLWVTDPVNLDHKLLRGVLSNSAIDVMPIKDPALLASLPDGTVIYQPLTIALEKGWKPKKVETVCTSSLVLMRRDANERLLSKVADLISLQRELIAPIAKPR